MPIQVDCKGLVCPQPVLRTRDALACNPGQTIEVLVDNEASHSNVLRFAASQQCQASSIAEADGSFRITIVPGEATVPGPVNPADYPCEIGGQLVYVIASSTMGRGDDRLGASLLSTYIQTIKEIDPLPAKIIFYNSGVKLVCEQSAALDALRHLQARGVSILACGTCLDYYQLKAQIQVGQISNMFEIMSAVNTAVRVMSPL